jgi:multidrug efflux pump subunit AcrA (membrane-fusion protein)
VNDDGLTKYARYHLRKQAEAAGLSVEAYQEQRAAIKAQQAVNKAQRAAQKAEAHARAEARRLEAARRAAKVARERKERERARAEAARQKATAARIAARRFDKATGRTLAADTGEVLGMYDRRCCGACGIPWAEHTERHDPPERPRLDLVKNPLSIDRAQTEHEYEDERKCASG